MKNLYHITDNKKILVFRVKHYSKSFWILNHNGDNPTGWELSKEKCRVSHPSGTKDHRCLHRHPLCLVQTGMMGQEILL
jgi:hypothetical protein